MLPSPSTYMDSQFLLDWALAPFQCANDTRGYAGGMPIHSHHGAERLKPEWVGQSAQKFVASVFMNDSFGDYGPKPSHSATPANGVHGRRGAGDQRCRCDGSLFILSTHVSF